MDTSDAVVFDVSQIIGFQPLAKRRKETQTHPRYDSHFLSFADIDYVVFRSLALGGAPRPSLFHLQQAVEKYLKAIVLASVGALDEESANHDVVALIEAASVHSPTLRDRSARLFCERLKPYQLWGHYPEMVLDQVYWKPGWNEGRVRGVSEADLFIATLRAAGIAALGVRAVEVGTLESLVHREIPFNAGTTAEQHLREALLTHNLFFTQSTLPTYAQRYQGRTVFPLQPLPRIHP